MERYAGNQSFGYGRQIDYLRKLEPPHQPAFQLQVISILTACFTAYFLTGWWECAVWSVAYVISQLCEKMVVRIVPRNPSPAVFYCVLGVLVLQASVYCFLPLYLWYTGPDIAKFGALALITASTMHTMLHRAVYPSILLCFLIPDATVFAVISGTSVVMHGFTDAAILYLVVGLAICIFFFAMFFQAYQKEVNAQREMIERRSAERARERSEIRFKNLFESAPIPIREEDLSGIKRLIDAVDIPDPAKFKAYLDQNPDFIEACKAEIIVVDANMASIEEHGYPNKRDMLARVLGELSPAAMKIVRHTILALHSGETRQTFETRIKRVDGEVRTVAATWSVIPGHEDTYARILLCSLDVTDQRKSEAALRQAQKMEAVGQLTGGVAHDFNNLLTVIGGNIELMEVTGEFDTDLSDPIKKSVQRGAELTQRLLAFSRKQPLAPRAINLNHLVLEMSILLRRSLGEGIAIENILDDTLWPALADPGQVEGAILNMALNSRDAMQGQGTLSISSKNMTIGPEDPVEVEPGEYVVLSVMDTGSGMTPEVIARACEPFFTTKEVGKGSGLGLPSVYGFAKQSGGDVQISSKRGAGTTISLFLPRSDQAVPRISEKADFAGDRMRSNGTILILEDNIHVLTYLEKLLDSHGFGVLDAKDVPSARNHIANQAQIDLLLSDVSLPGGSCGPEFASELLRSIPDTPIIFITGRPDEVRVDDFPNLSSSELLPKPFSSKQLIEKIETALKIRRS